MYSGTDFWECLSAGHLAARAIVLKASTYY
jgi:hypothetical protein